MYCSELSPHCAQISFTIEYVFSTPNIQKDIRHDSYICSVQGDNVFSAALK